MSRRIPTSRRPSMESLEARCNPAALVPIAEPLVELAPVNGNLQITDLTSVAIDPFTPSAPARPYSLNGFAGQTVKIPLDPRTGDLYVGNDDGVYVGGVGRDVLLGGAGQDQHSAPTGKLYLGTNVGVFVTEAGGLDVLIADTGSDRIEQTGGISKLGSKLLVIQGDGNYVGSGAPVIATGSLSNFKYIEDPSPSSAPETPVNLSAFAGQTIRLRIAATNNQGKLIVGVDDVQLRASVAPAAGNLDNDRFVDIVAGVGALPHVKSADGGAGDDILVEGTATHDNGHGTHVSGTVAADVHGAPAPASSGFAYATLTVGGQGGLYSGGAGRDVLLGGAGQDQRSASDTATHEVGHWMGLYHTFSHPGLESIIDDLARDVASHRESSFPTFPDFTGSVTVAGGDVNGDVDGDGFSGIITGSATTSTHVK